MEIYLILISFISLLTGFYIGKKYENYRLIKEADENLKKSIEKINYLTNKIIDHQNSDVIFSDERNIEILQYNLSKALEDEEYETAAELRDIINSLKDTENQ